MQKCMGKIHSEIFDHLLQLFIVICRRMTRSEHVTSANRRMQGCLPELVLHPHQRRHPPIFTGDLFPSCQLNEESGHRGVSGPGGGVQRRAAAAVACAQEVRRLVVGCYDVECGVPVWGDPFQEQGRRWLAHGAWAIDVDDDLNRHVGRSACRLEQLGMHGRCGCHRSHAVDLLCVCGTKPK